MGKPREFYLEPRAYGTHRVSDRKLDGAIHVIEYSAYEELKEELALVSQQRDDIAKSSEAEIERLTDALSKACAHLFMCNKRLKAPEPYMIEEANEALQPEGD